jgi:hypothetical protein
MKNGKGMSQEASMADTELMESSEMESLSPLAIKWSLAAQMEL